MSLPSSLVAACSALALLAGGCSGSNSAGSSGSSTGGSGSATSGSSSGDSGGSGGTSGAGGSASFVGELGFTAVNAVAKLARYPDAGIHDVIVVALNGPDSCARTGNPPAPYYGFKLEVLSYAGTLAPGTFPVHTNADPSASADIFSSDAGGLHLGSGYIFPADGGTATLTTVDDTHVTGSASLSMHLTDGGESHLDGTFDAVTCP